MSKVKKAKEKETVKKSMTQFAVIGLGRFGISLARSLFENGMDVLAIDTDHDAVNRAGDFTTHAVCADAADEHVLAQLGIGNFDAVIVCIGGDNTEASIFVTLLCKQLGAKYIISKAVSATHKRVLEKIGADLVIFPEEYMGQKVSEMLTNPTMLEVLELTDNYRLVEIKTPAAWQNKTLAELDLRGRYGVSILIIKRGETVLNNVTGETCLLPGDELIIGGDTAHTEKVKKLATETVADLEDLT